MSPGHHFSDTQFTAAQSHGRLNLRSVREYLYNQISFWSWELKLSRQYNEIMKQRQSQPMQGDNNA